MRNIWSVIDQWRQNSHWWSRVIFSAHGVNLDSRMMDRILYVVGQNEWSLRVYYSLFYHPVGDNQFSKMYIFARCFLCFVMKCIVEWKCWFCGRDIASLYAYAYDAYSQCMSYRVVMYFFMCVLLTVHLSITLVNDQLVAQFFYFIIRLLQSSTCFEQRRAHHQEVKLY